jgi:GNAT superfamily N-acetyltransferase
MTFDRAPGPTGGPEIRWICCVGSATMHGMNTVFCGAALAERIERVEAQFIAAATEAARRRGASEQASITPFAGGSACFAEAGSPLNKVAGLGFGGIPNAGDLTAVERKFAECGAATQIELANLADPELGAVLTARGYRLVGFENVLGRSLDDEPERVMPPGIDVRTSGDDEFDAWLDVVVEGFANPDTEGVASHEEFPREVVERAVRDCAEAGVKRYVARHDGVVAGGASVRMSAGIAQLAGAATALAHRRRGVQTALLAAHLIDAARAGCDIAVVTTVPGSKSQQNAQRRGFQMLYTRAMLVKPLGD